jgi:hypothetical protein
MKFDQLKRREFITLSAAHRVAARGARRRAREERIGVLMSLAQDDRQGQLRCGILGPAAGAWLEGHAA